MTAAWLQQLVAETQKAEQAEQAFRQEAARRTAELAQQRAFAYRRLNLLRDVAAAVAAAPDAEVATGHGLAVLRTRLGWHGDSAAQEEVVAQFAPVCAALREPAQDAKEAPPDPAAVLADFEAWFQAARGTPFWTVFEVYMPETPRVDY